MEDEDKDIGVSTECKNMEWQLFLILLGGRSQQ